MAEPKLKQLNKVDFFNLATQSDPRRVKIANESEWLAQQAFLAEACWRNQVQQTLLDSHVKGVVLMELPTEEQTQDNIHRVIRRYGDAPLETATLEEALKTDAHLPYKPTAHWTRTE